MAKIAETYLAFKFSRLVKDGDDSSFVIESELNDIIAAAIETILTEAGHTGIIIEVVSEE